VGLRINHNLASLGAAMNLGRANSALSSSLAKLSTGLKINNASDGPADLIISEKFRSQINAISKATENTQNAISMLSTAEGALNEVNSLLNKMQGLALKAAQTGTQSTDEIAASQAEIDSALEAINNISRNTSFGSLNLLDGSQSIQTTGVDTSKLLVSIDKANFAGDTKDLNVKVVKAAVRAATTIDLSAVGQNDPAGTDGILSESQVLKLTGNRGSTTITFAAGSSYLKMAEEINSQMTQTGVIAEAGDNKVTLKSAQYGATEFVTVEDVDGDNDLLIINPTTVANPTDTKLKIVDLSKGGLGQSFSIGGVEIRSLGALGSKYKGYTVNFATTTSAVGGVIAFVNDAAKTIDISASVGASFVAVATALTTNTGISFAVVNSAAALTTIVAADNDQTGNLIVSDVTSNLRVTAKAGTSAATHSEGPSITIVESSAADVSYNSNTNTITLQIVNGTAYTDTTLDAIITGAADTTIQTLFDFDMINGGGTIDKTSSSTPVKFSETSVSTSNRAVDLSTAKGMGVAFRGGGTSNFGVKTTDIGTEKFANYTIKFKATTGVGAATTSSIDHENKAITLTVSTATVLSDAVAALNTLVADGDGLTYFAKTAETTAASAVAETGEVTSAFTVDASNLTVTAKNNSDASFRPKIVIAETGTQGISYSSATQTITLNLAAATTVLDTQAELETLLDSSATGAQIRSLFDLKVNGVIQGTTVDAVELTPGGVIVGTSDSQVRTNYVKASGTDGSLEVNGVKTAANNLSYTFDNGNIRGDITIDEKFNVAGNISSFKLAGKGAFLQLGQKTQLSHQTGVGIQSVAANQLATGLYLDTSLDPTTANLDNSKLYTTATLADITSGGDFDLAKNAQTAFDIISKAITEVSQSRAKLGALISNTLESNINSLGVAFENLTASESRIRDVDFASETAEFTRAQILVQAGTSVAAQANVATQAALQLLG
jgi:flagellin